MKENDWNTWNHIITSTQKLWFCTPDGDTDFFKIVSGVLQGDPFVPYMFIICLDSILWMSLDLIKENSFILK